MTLKACIKANTKLTDEDAAAVVDANKSGLGVVAAVDSVIAQVEGEIAETKALIDEQHPDISLPEVLKTQSGDGQPSVDTDKIPEMLKPQSGVKEDQLELDLTPEGHRASDEAQNKPMREGLIEDLSQATELAEANTLLESINSDLVDDGTYSPIGKTVNSPEELATLAQVWRDPRWETMRYVFIKGGKVVGHSGFSQRLPGQATLFNVDNEKGINWLKEKMTGLGADGYWMLHNHPSGNPTPSRADLSSTSFLNDEVGGLQGHIIIDSNKYAHIAAQGGPDKLGSLDYYEYSSNNQTAHKIFDKEFFKGKDKTINQPNGSVLGYALAGEKITGVNSATDIAARLQHGDNFQIVLTNSKLHVGAILEVDKAVLEDMDKLKRLIKAAAQKHGGNGVFLMNVPTTANVAMWAAPLSYGGYVMDVINTDGVSAAAVGATVSSAKTLGVKGDMFGISVAESSEQKRKPNEVFRVSVGDQRVEVIQNPTDNDISQLHKEVKQEYPNRFTGDPALRWTNDEYGNRYVWKAHEGAHQFIEPEITKKTGSNVDQNNPDNFVREDTEAKKKYAGNINKSKFRNLDVPSILQSTYNANTKKIEGERRGKISWAKTESLAQDLGMSVQDLKKRRRGKAFSAEELDRARALTQQSAEAVLEAARSGNREALLKAMASHVEVQAKYSGAVAEAGRALQILRKQTMELKEVNRIANDVFQGDPDRAVEMIQTFETTGQVSKFTRDVFQPGVADVLLEIWINALLSGPQTHAVNIMSNGIVQGFSVVEDAVASLGGAFRKQDRITLRDTLARAQGLMFGTVDASKGALKAFQTEEPSDPQTKLEMDYRAIRAETFGLDPRAASGKMVNFIGKKVRIPGRALTAMDDFYKIMSRRGTIAQLATRMALAKGFKGDKLAEEIQRLQANPTEEMIKKAMEVASYTTFTNTLGPFGQGIQSLVAKVPILRLVAPFIRTPTNILKFAIDRSPAAIGFKHNREALMGKKGKVNRDIAWSRVILGTGIGYMIAQATMDGLVSGGGPDDKTKKAMKYTQGWQPYSILRNGTWYSYARLEPFGMLFGISADMVEIMDQMKDDEVDNVAGLIVGSIAKNLTSKTWLRGMSEFVQMLADPDRYGSRYVQRLSGTVIPTGLAQWARTEDPALREARTIMDNIRSRYSPGSRRELYPRLDRFGEPIVREGGVGPDIVSPIYKSKQKSDPVAKEVEELGVSWGKPSRKIMNVELTDGQYHQYATIVGKYSRNMLDAVVRSPGYQRMPAWSRKDIVEKMIRNARKQAQTVFVMNNPNVLIESNEQKLEQMR